MQLSDLDKALLDGAEGEAARQAMDALVQLGQAYDAPDMVDIGYAHVHAGMALYKGGTPNHEVGKKVRRLKVALDDAVPEGRVLLTGPAVLVARGETAL